MSRTAVEQIKERLTIVEVVGSYVELKNAGKNYKAKSPFTNEKTPSFYVSPDRGMYYCFSSQKGGDMFTFVQEMEGVDFKGALKILAEKAHVELVPEDPKKRDAREIQYALLEEATQYFFKTRESAPLVDAYILERGVTMQTMHAWRIGYAKDEWRSLRTHLSVKGYTDAQMLAAGLIKKTDQGKEPYDVFRDRIMFPIFDTSGRVVAFSGRTMKKEEGTPKYVNSPETELFVKSDILYGYDKAKQGIRHYDFSLLVEGQFDLVLSHQAGYTNAVAVSGTAFTPHHLSLLERLSTRIVLALDADRAGVTAVKRIAGMMLSRGMDVKVARMEGGKDPADIIKANPVDFKHFVGHAVHVVEFLLGVLKEGMKDERTYKLRVREEILPLLVTMENRIDREHFEGVIAEQIGATKEGVHYEVERLEALHKNAPKAPSTHDASPVLRKEVLTTNRQTGLYNHICALMHVCVEERSWIGERIAAHMETILSPEAFSAFKEAEVTPLIQAEIFTLEEHLEGLREKYFLEEVSDVLTHYTHTMARDHLGALRKQLGLLEAGVDDVKEIEILTEMKKAEKLLQAPVKIDKE
ncbi:DNA primase [Candidatus Kaiserbacteria bacterium]|nr:MAG: DNA primase [Candidatus Kaiserbacteria bacterium]